MQRQHQLKVVKTFNTRIEAELGKGLLQSNGIRSLIVADDEGGMTSFPFQPNSSGVKLLVREKDYDIAVEIIKQ